ATSRVARRFHKSGFTVAFFVLGLLTSISEISVMVNATLEKVPQVSAGNLAGASFVILLLIVPILAILGNGVQLRHTIRYKYLAAGFVVIMLPNLFMLDGSVTKAEGIICLLAYAVIAWLVGKEDGARDGRLEIPAKNPEEEGPTTAHWNGGLKAAAIMLASGAFIFAAGRALVNETAFFSGLFGIPGSIGGLLLLSVGTNVPELVIAMRSVLKKHKDIAFGDYLGSSLTNTLVFGCLAVFGGRFAVESGEFLATAILLATGLSAFYLFAKSKNSISRSEGLMLLSFYALFLIAQVINAARFAAG
ncbi:MAG TPA: hypothetical protein VHB73_00410, partial [Alphaproteobacteria bacterium]|nr:hypothetical protein [Alphaproteobacteria bacterium]